MGFVLDASVLIHFVRARAWDLLEEVTEGDFVVPTFVMAEASLGSEAQARQIRHLVGDRVVDVGPLEVDDDRLGPGERAVLAAADDQVAVLDDRRARTWAKALGIECTGTVGLLLRLRGRDDVVEAFERMLDTGMWLDGAIATRVADLLSHEGGSAQDA